MVDAVDPSLGVDEIEQDARQRPRE